MEFDEIKKIWDSQNNEPLYGINEKALHNRILSKRKKAQHITNFSELFSIIAFMAAGCLIMGMNIFGQNKNIFMYFIPTWLFSSTLYLVVSRIRRKRRDNRFDRSMHGDLNHAISVAAYQVRLSQLGRWNILILGVLILLGVWEGGRSTWITVGILIFFVLTHYAAGWEHRIYEARKRELEVLQKRLENEDLNDRPS